MTKLAELKKKYMNDPEFRKEYDKADLEYSIIELLIRARTQQKCHKKSLRSE